MSKTNFNDVLNKVPASTQASIFSALGNLLVTAIGNLSERIKEKREIRKAKKDMENKVKENLK